MEHEYDYRKDYNGYKTSHTSIEKIAFATTISTDKKLIINFMTKTKGKKREASCIVQILECNR